MSLFWFPPQNNRVRRFAFELKMQDKSSYLLAADSEAEMEEWVTVLNKILQLNFEAAMQEKRNGDSHEGRQAGFPSVCTPGGHSWFSQEEPSMRTFRTEDVSLSQSVCRGFHHIRFPCPGARHGCRL